MRRSRSRTLELHAPVDPWRRDRATLRRPAGARAARRPSALGVASALSCGVGVAVLAAGAWFFLVQDAVIGHDQVAAAAVVNATSTPSATPTATDQPPVAAPPAVLTDFATIYVPRFGDDYVRVIREGTGVGDVLNQGRIGHYTSTAMPGGVGNFAIAGHRSAYGGAMHLIDRLQPGDQIFVRTADGWYTYVYQSQAVVDPTAVATIAPVPNNPGATPTQRYLTLTTCDPLYSSENRIAAWALLDSWQPLSAGAPIGVPALALAITGG